ncbi:hypothetical protein DYBT9275_00379 [Dyadobacter sp. CECT 9275]|uniref:Fibronectin type-III domain-containing protein n=1 Tax=Dyadobacter helix TaxID=2822344 RepID=A0A916N446_9BACT|nr:sialate O-acetylesterase [Dyadobacter sp. CECT 9275]CAG4989781.1 hypothetical protein DYBT9275_00379 [Dyadobacter sp. CECT 9275]
MNFTFLKRTLFLIILCTWAGQSHGQRFYSVVFNNLPKDNQLYAREDDNTAEVPISGLIETAGWDHMSVVTYRNQERLAYNKAMLNYGSNFFANFDLKPKIKAEMADYSFEIYACKTTDSVLIAKRIEVVAGDFYVISGQSNASASQYGSWSSKYARTIARIPDNDPSVLPGDTLWVQSSWSWPYTGAWGIELQKNILENYGIPTCVINGGLPGSFISYHLDRNAQDPSTPTLYGLLYRRIKAARAKRIRTFFWYQGEQEALENIPNYAAQYDKLFKYWQTDYPQVEKFMVVQIPVLFNPYYIAGTIREFQRSTRYIYPKTDHFNVSGLPGFDGIHYSLAGYQELGRRFYRFLAPMIYGGTDTSNVACPDIVKVFYSSEKKDEITLQYESNQTLVWPKDTLMDDVNGNKFLKSLRDVYFFDGDESKPAGVTAGSASGNFVTLKLAGSSTAKKLNYLPAYKGEQVKTYYGPFLKNLRGLGAFSFQEVAIADALVFSKLKAEESDRASVMVSWESAGAQTYVLEKMVENGGGYLPLKTFDSKTLSYEDTDVSAGVTYSYRIQAFSPASQSAAQTVTIKTSPILAVNPHEQASFWDIYPNPVSAQLSIDFKTSTSGTLQLFNVGGEKIKSLYLSSCSGQQLNMELLPAGPYIISFTKRDGTILSRKILKK